MAEIAQCAGINDLPSLEDRDLRMALELSLAEGDSGAPRPLSRAEIEQQELEQAIVLSMATAAAEAGTRGQPGQTLHGEEEKEETGFAGHHVSPDPLVNGRARPAAKWSFQMRSTYSSAARPSTTGTGRRRRRNMRRTANLGRLENVDLGIQSMRHDGGEGPIAWPTSDEEELGEPQTPVMTETSAPMEHKLLLTPQRGTPRKRSRQYVDRRTEECTTTTACAPSPEPCSAAIVAYSQPSTAPQPIMTSDHVADLPMLRSFSVSQKVLWRANPQDIRLAKVKSIDARSLPQIYNLEVLSDTGDPLDGSASSAISTAHDLFPVLEHGEMVWLRTWVPDGPDSPYHNLASSVRRVDIVAEVPGSQRSVVRSQGDSDCIIVDRDVPSSEALSEDGLGVHNWRDEDGAQDQMAMGEVSSSFQGRIVWEAARVIWCDLFQLEPEVHLVLCSRHEPVMSSSFNIPDSSPQILARMSDVMLRMEVGEGSGIKRDDGGQCLEACLSQTAMSEDDVVPPSLDALMAADQNCAIDLTQEG